MIDLASSYIYVSQNYKYETNVKDVKFDAQLQMHKGKLIKCFWRLFD